jgi:DNA-binding NarL/FixJ family response regulator
MLCLSARAEPKWIRAAFEAGAHGYVLKRNAIGVLMDAVDAVMRLGGYISADIAHVVVGGFRNGGRADAAGDEPLSSREREVTRLYAEGLATREIADKLHLSMKTIGTHRDHIMAKLGIRGIAQLTRYALREGLVPLEA